MTKKEEKAFLREVEATGKYSLYHNARIYLNFRKILETTTNPQEFEKVWEKVPAASKLFFLQNSITQSENRKKRCWKPTTKRANRKN